MQWSAGLKIGAAVALAVQFGAVAHAHDPEIHTFHCWQGCPVGASETNDLIVREIYTLSSNDETKFADWVAYRVTREAIGTSEGRRWAADPWLDPSETLEPADYRDAPAALGIDRGHQAPLATFSGTAFAADTNYLSNITPQASALNQGPWQYLEGAERDYARRTGRLLYVLTGPLFERNRPPLPRADEPHRNPSGYWKLIVSDTGELNAFIFEQETPRSASYCSHGVTLEEVERRTGLRFFPRLSRRSFGSLGQQLGCTVAPNG